MARDAERLRKTLLFRDNLKLISGVCSTNLIVHFDDRVVQKLPLDFFYLLAHLRLGLGDHLASRGVVLACLLGLRSPLRVEDSSFLCECDKSLLVVGNIAIHL